MLTAIKGRKTQNFYSILCEDIGEEAASNVLDTVNKIFSNAPMLGGPEEKKMGLLYGLIQSGKTNVINMTVALAADNGYKLFIILTDKNNSLQNQTYDRADEAITGMLVRKMDEISNEDPNFIKTVMSTKGLVLICKKDKGDLDKLITFLKKQDFSNFPVLIADDEADAVGLNTNQYKEDEGPSPINQHLLDIRNLINCHLYLQVTATPQAVILQNNEPGGFYPQFIEVAEAGTGYNGIHTFFQNNKDEHVRDVDGDEVERLADRENEDDLQLPEGLLKALSTFLIGASVKIIENNGQKADEKFSFLCHISPFQKIHSRIQELCKKFIENVFMALQDTEEAEYRKFILNHLSDAYSDLRKTNESMPIFSDVLTALSDNITSYDVIVLNGAKDSNKDIKLSKKYNFIIGGNKLGRGLTIPRLIVTYYGRRSANPQVDTLMQHARMCGYRSKDLSVTRIFLPDDIANLFEEICEHDTIQREIIQNQSMTGTLYLDSDRLRPTRPSVIPKSVGAYKSGQITFAKLPGHRKDHITPVTKEVDKIVSDFHNPRVITEIDIESAKKIIELIPVEISGGYHPEVISKYLSWYSENYAEESIQFLYETGTDIGLSGSRGNRIIASVLSPGLQKIVKQADSNIPILILVKNSGEKLEKEEFWIPLFKFPEGDKNILFNLNNV